MTSRARETQTLAVAVRRAFDAVAPVYDRSFAAPYNALMGWLRQENLALLKATFPPNSRLLEIGCGTGEEAVALARRGALVVATDISPAMVRRTRQRAHRAGVAHRVQTLVLPAGQVAALRPPVPFDGVYSSFGALNCEPDLATWARGVASLVQSDGLLVCSVINRWCLWEVMWFALRGRWQVARRRWTREWQVAQLPASNGRRVPLPFRYLTAGDMVTLLSPYFVIEQVMALPVCLPPPALDPLYRRYPRLFGLLRRVEHYMRDRWPWRYLGDHVVIVARRRP